MKILIFNGGPRKGNTWLLTEKAKAYLQEFDPAIVFEEVHLARMGLPFCTGCSNCFIKGHETCPHHKIVQPVIDLIEESDAVIFSVPCFQMHLPGIMKNFTDHMAFMLHRPRYFRKKALIVTTTGGVGADRTTKSLAGTLANWGMNKCFQLPITALSWNDYHPTEKDLKKTRTVCEDFYRDVKSGKLHAPGFWAVFPFNLFQGICEADGDEPEYPTEDHRYWRQYRGMRYAPGIPLPPIRRLWGWLVYVLGKKMSKSMGITYRK